MLKQNLISLTSSQLRRFDTNSMRSLAAASESGCVEYHVAISFIKLSSVVNRLFKSLICKLVEFELVVIVVPCVCFVVELNAAK